MTLEYNDTIYHTKDLKLQSKVDLFIKTISAIEDSFGLHMETESDSYDILIIDDNGFIVAKLKNGLDW